LNSSESLNVDSPLSVAIRKGSQAAWQSRWAGLCLWLFGMLIIIGYFNSESIRGGLEYVGRVKEQTGFAFAMISTAIFGGLLPTVIPILFGRPRQTGFWSLLISNVVFWAIKGLEIDLLYKFQAWLFGNQNDVATIAGKVLLDLAIYAPLFGLLTCVLFYIWRDNGYSLSKTRKRLGPNWYVKTVLPALISNWCVWLPSVIMIYSLPLALQLPVQNLILSFWVLVLVFFTASDASEDLDSEVMPVSGN